MDIEQRLAELSSLWDQMNEHSRLIHTVIAQACLYGLDRASAEYREMVEDLIVTARIVLEYESKVAA